MIISAMKKSLAVAPLVGAWIEIDYLRRLTVAIRVAPLVGAWIEISGRRTTSVGAPSLLSWERGLKFVGVFFFVC